ncbi:MAG: HTTM domain-containing protein [Pseudomonadota bacterium]
MSDSVPRTSPWSRLFTEERDAYVLGLLRLALSVLLLLNCGRLILELRRGGYFGEFFHISMVPESWLPSSAGYASILGIQALAALCACFALWPREALLVSSALGLFVLSLDRLQYHNNRYALLLLGFLLAFTPCDRSFLLARRRQRTLPAPERIAPTFARRLFQIQVSLVYLGSACGKLLDSDWRGGQVLLLRFANTADFWAARGVTLPPWSNVVLSSALFASVAAKAAISTELFIALGAWFARTRRAALWVGVWFHFSIEVSARVELFSWLMLASYLAFVTPELRARRLEFDPRSARARALARAIRWLDWCARFEVVERPQAEHARARVYVTDRAGNMAHGFRGFALLAEAVPALFPLWAPFAVLARLAAPRSKAPSYANDVRS